MNSLTLITNYNGNQDLNRSQSLQKADIDILPKEILSLIFESLDLDSLKKLNESNKFFKLETEKFGNYAEDKKIHSYAKKIISECESKIIIEPLYFRVFNEFQYTEDNIKAISTAVDKCRGNFYIHLENSSISIDVNYTSNTHYFQQGMIKKWLYPNDKYRNYYTDKFTYTVKDYRYRPKENLKIDNKDTEIEIVNKAVKLAEIKINKLLEINAEKSKNFFKFFKK